MKSVDWAEKNVESLKFTSNSHWYRFFRADFGGMATWAVIDGVSRRNDVRARAI